MIRATIRNPACSQPPSSHGCRWLAHGELAQGHGDGTLAALAHHGHRHALAGPQAGQYVAEGRLTAGWPPVQPHDHVTRTQAGAVRRTLRLPTADQRTVLHGP